MLKLLLVEFPIFFPPFKYFSFFFPFYPFFLFSVFIFQSTNSLSLFLCFFLKVLFFSGYMVIIRSTDFKALKSIIYFFSFFHYDFSILFFKYYIFLISYIIDFLYHYFLFPIFPFFSVFIFQSTNSLSLFPIFF